MAAYTLSLDFDEACLVDAALTAYGDHLTARLTEARGDARGVTADALGAVQSVHDKLSAAAGWPTMAIASAEAWT